MSCTGDPAVVARTGLRNVLRKTINVKMTETKTPSSTNRYKWTVVFMLWFICFFNYADRQAIFSVFPILEKELGLSTWQLGIVGSSFMWVYAAFAPVAGLIGDKFKRKTLILAGLAFWSLVTGLTGISTAFWHLVTFRAAEGFGEAFYFPASMSLISDYHSKETRSRAMSFHQSSVYAGTIGGGAFAGFMAEYYGWRLGFYIFGALGIVLAVVLMKFIREPLRGASESNASSVEIEQKPLSVREVLPEIWRTPTALALMAVFFCANFVAMVFLTWMPSFLNKKFQMNLAMAGLTGTAFIQIASVLGVLTGGALADHLARRKASGRITTQMIGLICGAPFIFLTGWTLSIPVLILGMTGFGFFKGIYDANIFASLYDVVRPRARATAAGIMIAVGWGGGALAPIAVGVASERWGLSYAIAYNGAFYILAALMMAFAILVLIDKDAKKIATQAARV
jgi:MFS family permease